MASYFDSVGVIKCAPKIESSNFRWILWPTYAWKVLVPITTQRPLNVFQRAVLKLVRSGEHEVMKIADMLDLSPDLIELVILELEDEGCVTTAGKITQRGKDVLDELVSDDDEEFRVVHVFKDALTGEVWPLILQGELPFVEVTRKEDGHVAFLSGTTGAPQSTPIFEMRNSLHPARPRPDEILKASKRQRRRVKGGLDPDYSLGSAERISFIEDEGVPVHFATRVYQNQRGEVLVQEPFGPDDSPKLLRALQKAMYSRDGVGLKNYLKQYFEHDSENPTLTGLEQEAAHLVQERFTLTITRHEELFDYLVAMKRAHLEMCLPDAPADKVDDFLLKAQKALEQVMSEWNLQFPFNFQTWNKFSRGEKKSINPEFLEAQAEEAGFDIPLPKSIVGVRWGKVNHVLKHGGSGLRPGLIVNIMSAAANPTHPLRNAIEPGILHRIDSLAGARDKTAHAGGMRPSTQTAETHLKTVFEVIDLFLELQ
jgi:hypothetical protein